jgi:hypothetical protein
VHALRHPVEPAAGELDLDQRRRVQLRDRPRVAADATVQLHRVLTVDVGGERLDPELGSERREPVLRRPDPLAADLDHLAVAEVLVQRPPADPVAGLEDRHGRAAVDQRPSGRQPREPGADDEDVSVDAPRHQASSRTPSL